MCAEGGTAGVWRKGEAEVDWYTLIRMGEWMAGVDGVVQYLLDVVPVENAPHARC